ncbi:tautomerase family protein [Pedobacter fastidiosus]|nr:tautomerase family protein [Pedobacter fastidiosus]
MPTKKHAMPYLQLEVIRNYPYATKKLLAKRIGETYSKIMKADQNRITVSIRELGEGSIWRCGDEEPMPAAIMMCDIRKGRDAHLRIALSKALIEMCNEVLGLETGQLNIEFTQHSGDEMYHQRLGSFSADWTANEGSL